MATGNQKDEIVNRIRKILASFLKIKEDDIRGSSHLADDLGIDSVDFWEVVAKVEKQAEVFKSGTGHVRNTAQKSQRKLLKFIT